MSVKELRSQTAEHMRNHAGDFLPFLTNPDTGDMYTTGNAYRYKPVFCFNKGQSGFHFCFSAGTQMSLRSTAATWSTRQPGADSWKWALVYLGAPHALSFDNLPRASGSFSVASFDASSAAAHRRRPVQLGRHKDRRGVWRRTHHPRVCCCFRCCHPDRGSWHGIWCDQLHEPVCWSVPAGTCVTRMDSESITILWSG